MKQQKNEEKKIGKKRDSGVTGYGTLMGRDFPIIRENIARIAYIFFWCADKGHQL